MSLVSPKKWPFHYGYWIVGCTALGIAVSAPGQTIGVSVFTDDLIQSLDTSRLTLSTAYMVGTVLSAFLITRLGDLIDRRGARQVATAAALGLGLTLAVLSQVDRVAGVLHRLLPFLDRALISFVTVTVAFLFLRFTGQGALSLASRTMLMKWFRHRRGRMNSLAGITASFMFAGAPWCFEILIQRFGWRGAWLVMGAGLVCGVTALVWIFFRDDPESCGLRPDAAAPLAEGEIEEEEPEENWTLAEARRTRTFWIFNLASSLQALYGTAVVFHVVSIFAAAGYSRATAVTIFLPSAVISVSTQLISGWWSDRARTLKPFLALQMTALAISAVGVLQLSASWGIALVIFGNGLASGIFTTLLSVAWPRFFGRLHLGAISGLNMSWLVFFSAVGPFLFGLSEDLSGGYAAAVWACAGAAGALALAGWWADAPRRGEWRGRG